VNVKAQAILNGVAWVREKYGAQGLETVLGACTPAVRERCSSAIAINWHPHEELAEFLGVADRIFGHGDGVIAEAIGASAARANLRHLALRLAFFLARPPFLMRRVAGVWRQFNEEGEMLVQSFRDGAMDAELVEISRPEWIICCSVTGWLYEAGVATGMKQLVATHPECRARAGARCIWHLRWNATSG
jgi:hypothetical protein